jgi:hypothetical protein
MKFKEFQRLWALGNCNQKEGIVSVDFASLKEDILLGLVEDVEALVQDNISSEVASKDHITNWTKPIGQASQYSLFNKNGEFDDFTSDHNGNNIGKTSTHLLKYKNLHAFVDAIPSKLNCRLNRMGKKGGGLSPHEEHIFLNSRWLNISSEMRIRIHVVLKTNDDAKMYLRKEEYQYELGGVYGFNNGAVHSAINNGDDDRYHIVMDCKLTKEVYEFFCVENSLFKTDFHISKPIGLFKWSTFESYGGLDSIYKRLKISNPIVLSKLYQSANKIRAFIVRNGFLRFK